jgi:rare lipoprotein A
MRSFMVSMAIALATMIAGSLPAAASWNCNGPEFVCGSGSSGKSVSSGYAKSEKVSHKAKKSKSYETASLSSDDEAPAKHKKSKHSYNSDSDEGGSSYQSGMASYYWEPQQLASGGRFNPNALTAAHKTLPFGTRVRVTNQHNGSSVVVTINDRGPYVGGRVIDLSKAAAQEIGMTGAGVAPVKIAVLSRG